jgi:hypothetical protein
MTVFGDDRVTWVTAEPGRLEFEVEHMASVAPDMTWNPDLSAWIGPVPKWPFARPEPAGLANVFGETLFVARVQCSHAHPIAPPQIFPQEPFVDPAVRGLHDWHVNGDGSICLFQNPRVPAADLVVKVAGWYVEYRLMELGRITTMTTNGIVNDPVLDELIAQDVQP